MIGPTDHITKLAKISKKIPVQTSDLISVSTKKLTYKQSVTLLKNWAIDKAWQILSALKYGVIFCTVRQTCLRIVRAMGEFGLHQLYADIWVNWSGQFFSILLFYSWIFRNTAKYKLFAKSPKTNMYMYYCENSVCKILKNVFLANNVLFEFFFFLKFYLNFKKYPSKSALFCIEDNDIKFNHIYLLKNLSNIYNKVLWLS